MPRNLCLILAASLALSGCGKGQSTGQAEVAASAAPPAFAVCASCHSADAGGGNRVGPNLHGVVGRKAGSEAGFHYSNALKESGIVWNAETLDRFLSGPMKMAPGTRMTTTVSDPARRAAIIAYLTRQSGQSK